MSVHALRKIREEMEKYWFVALGDDRLQEALLDEFNHEFSLIGGATSCPDLEAKLKELKKTKEGRQKIREIIERVKAGKPHVIIKFKPKQKKKKRKMIEAYA